MIFSKKGSTLEVALENYISHSLPIRSQMMKPGYTFSAVLTQCTLLIDMVLFSITTPLSFCKNKEANQLHIHKVKIRIKYHRSHKLSRKTSSYK